MPAPKVSVLLPMYNVEPYVEACLMSLLSQTSLDFEIIALDDCSPDRSGEIAARILNAQNKVPWKLVVNERNQGLAETRRIAAMQAVGDYVLCVDSDDYVEPNLIERVIEEAVKHDADVVMFAATNVNADGSVNYQIDSEDKVISGVEAVEGIMDLKLQAYCWNKLVRRSIFADVHHPSGLIYEDICVSVQTLGKSRTVRLIPDRLYFYVLRDSGISTRFNQGWVFNGGTTDWPRVLGDSGATSHAIVSQITHNVIRRFTNAAVHDTSALGHSENPMPIDAGNA